MNSEARRLTRIFIINQTLHWFMIGIVIPVITLFRIEKGLNLFEVGILGSISGGAIILLELPTGGLADAVGRKRVYILSLITIAAAGIILIAAPGVYMLGVGFLLLGAARALSSGAMDAWFVDEFYRVEEKSKLQSALARVNFFIPAGLGLAAFIGGWLPESLGRVMETRFGLTIYSANVAVLVPLAGIQMILTSLLVRETPDPDRAGNLMAGFRAVPKVLSSSLRYGIRDLSIFLLMLAGFAWGVGFSGLETFWQPQFRGVAGVRFEPLWLGFLTAGYFFAGSVGSLLSSRTVAWCRGRNTLSLFILRLVQGVFFIFLSIQTGIAGFSVFYILVFLFNGAQNPTQMAVFNGLVPGKERSTLLSFQSLFLQLGGLLGSLIMGYVAEMVSIPRAWWIGAGVLLLSSVLFLFVREKPDDTIEE